MAVYQYTVKLEAAGNVDARGNIEAAVNRHLLPQGVVDAATIQIIHICVRQPLESGHCYEVSIFTCSCHRYDCLKLFFGKPF